MDVGISMLFCFSQRTLTKWAIFLMVDDHHRFLTAKHNHRLSQLNTFNVTIGRLCGKLTENNLFAKNYLKVKLGEAYFKDYNYLILSCSQL